MNRRSTPLGAAALCAVTCSLLPAQDAPEHGPWTRAERSGFTETSRLADVEHFLDELRALPGAADFTIGTFGRSTADRPLLLVTVPALGDAADPLRVLVLANIHGGEVCGKEAVQILLRELARGEHAALRDGVELRIAPIYNVDGNERISTEHRRNVDGPTGGLGARTNDDGLDLNRDLIKAQAAETRALLGLLRNFDPQVFFDLHTTNGAPHAFELTYAPSLSPNVDPGLSAWLRDVHLPAVRAAVREVHDYRVFDYGNFSRRAPDQYVTFGHRPRYASNYVGLRNRLSILSEAYAYEPFEIRIRATRAFLLENLRHLQRHRERIVALCAAADRRCAQAAVSFGVDTELVAGERRSLPTRTWDRMPLDGGGTRVMRRSGIEWRDATVRTAFTAERRIALPAAGWHLPEDTPQQVLETLAAHGVRVERLATDRPARASRFTPTSGDRARRPYQGIRTVTLRGHWHPPEDTRLPAGSWQVPSRQPLARLAAQLLEPGSEDGLTTWGFWLDATAIATNGAAGRFPVRRLTFVGD